MFEKFKRYLANKLLPYAEVTPPKYEVLSLNVKTISAEVIIPKEWLVPEAVYVKELRHKLGEALKDYIKYERSEDLYSDKFRLRGSIRVVIDKE